MVDARVHAMVRGVIFRRTQGLPELFLVSVNPGAAAGAVRHTFRQDARSVGLQWRLLWSCGGSTSSCLLELDPQALFISLSMRTS